MSSSSNARVSSHAERRTATDNGSVKPRAPSSQQGGNRNDRFDGRRTQSPQPQQSTASGTHRRTASNSQRMRGGVEERRTERVHVTTKETLTSRTRSPERRPASMQPQDRPKPSEISKINSGDSRPNSRTELPQGNHLQELPLF
jgi:gamma-tubulin complex component 2